SWQAKQVLCSASSPGLPFLKSANPQPPVAAYFFESLTINCTFTADPATKDWRPAPGKPLAKTLLFSSDEPSFQCSAAIIVPSGNRSLPSRKALIAISLPNWARTCFRLPPAKWFTEIKRQSRYPGGILIP